MDAVVVTYNSAADLRGFVDSSASLAGFERIVVVDNNSSDDTVQVARKAGLSVIRRSRNDGFGAAANCGIRNTSSDAVAVMNPDVRLVQSDALHPLRHALADESVGLVAPALELPDGRIQDSARQVPMPWDLVGRRLTGASIGAIWPQAACDVPWVVGAFMVIKRQAFDDVGGFDLRYRLYFEDVDLCVRLWRRGWKVRFDPDVRVQHHHRAASRGSVRQWTTRQHIRSAANFYRRNAWFMLGNWGSPSRHGSPRPVTARAARNRMWIPADRHHQSMEADPDRRSLLGNREGEHGAGPGPLDW